MKKALLLIMALGVAASLSACGATTQGHVKAEQYGVEGSDQAQYESASAQQPSLWIYDTPFGY